MSAAVRFVSLPPRPVMPRLPRKYSARPKSWHSAVVRADSFEWRWQRLSELADETTLELMLKVTEEEE